jgi:putative ABC transport system substrate-binding protein
VRRFSRGTGLALVLGVLVAPAPSDAQQAGRPFRVGILHEAFVPSIPQVEGLKAGLKAMGLEEGRDLTFEIRFSRGKPEALPTAAAALANASLDVIFTSDEEATRVMTTATQAVPIVFVRVGDPVAAGIVAAIARPGGNVTGVSSLSTDLAPKRLELLKAIFPTVRRVWAVYHADDRSSFAAARRAQAVAPLLQLDLIVQAVRTPEELVGHLKGIRPGDGLLVPPSVAMSIPTVLLDLERLSRVPAVHFAAFWVETGGLVSYGSDLYGDGFQAARLVAKILRGSRPQDLPVEGPSKVELAINLKTARSLGVAVPPEVLARADRVIE